MGILDISEFDRQFMTDVVQSAGEPVVTPRRVVIEQPAPSQSFDLHTDASRRGDFGTPDEMIAYLRQVNRIPDNASAVIEFEPIRRLTHITFEWWDIEIKVKRRDTLGSRAGRA
ncbi:hypothetical protein SEA_DROPSHOT_63 [Microbacterium phage Dropshot]|nr:hypothetical protein SEA_DROPSHOT_63 [Microbacterium phage Dropshot]